jgi:serine protease Do
VDEKFEYDEETRENNEDDDNNDIESDTEDNTEINIESNEELNDGKSVQASGIDKNLRTFLISSVVILILLLAALIGYFIYIVNNSGVDFNFGFNSSNSSKADSSGSGQNNNSDLSNSGASIVIEDSPVEGVGMSAEEVYDKVSPTVVGVVVYDSEANIISDPKGQGSGIIVSSDGYIVTNSHVIGDSKQNNVKIVLSGGEEFPGKIVGYDTKTDLAVIKAEKTNLPVATFGNSDNVRIGQWALALGNPIGLTNSLTRGTISALNRSLSQSKQHFVKYIQTDAAINPGNSGGPLLNMYGQVIGITSTKIVGNVIEGVGFAIPSNTVKSVVDDIISKGYVSGRVKLGLTGKMVSHYQSQMYNVPIGMIISEINKDSDFFANGVQVGDIITKINDSNVTDLEVLYSELAKCKVGDSVKISVYRSTANRSNSSTFDVNGKLLEDKGV